MEACGAPLGGGAQARGLARAEATCMPGVPGTPAAAVAAVGTQYSSPWAQWACLVARTAGWAGPTLHARLHRRALVLYARQRRCTPLLHLRTF